MNISFVKLTLLFLLLTPAAQAASCPFALVPVPPKFASIDEGNLRFNSSVAFQTPSCKVVAIGDDGYRTYIARFENGEFDRSYEKQGWDILRLRGNYLLGPLFVAKVKERVGLVAKTVEVGEDEEGLIAAQMSLEGKVDYTAYNRGTAYKALGSRTNTLKVISVTEVGENFQVAAERYNFQSKKVEPFSESFAAYKPLLDHLQKPLPSTCNDMTYENHNAHNGQIFKLVPQGCAKLYVSWEHIIDIGKIERDEFTTETDGSCRDSKPFGRSCFHYENGDLVRTYVNSNWDVQKRYYGVVTANGRLCEVGGYRGLWMIASRFPSSDPRFTSDCFVY